MLDLNRLKELEKKATKGPWIIQRSDLDSADDVRVHGIYTQHEVSHEVGTSKWTCIDQIVETDSGFYPPKEDDAQLIVELRNVFPAIVERMEKLEKVREAADNFNKQYHKWSDDVENRIESILDGPLAALEPKP